MIKDLLIGSGKVIYYQSAPRKNGVLVVLNGWSTAYSNWYMIKDQLEQNFQVISPNFPGFWGSEPLAGENNIVNFAKFLEEFVKKLGIENFYLLGESLGADVGLTFAAGNPSLVRKACFVGLIYRQGKLLDWVGRIMKWCSKHKIGLIIADFVRQNSFIEWLWGKSFLQSTPLPKDFLERQKEKAVASKSSVWLEAGGDAILTQAWPLLEKVSFPLLLVYGTKDNLGPKKTETLSLPKNVFVQYFEGKHAPNRENPQEFLQLLLEFFLK